MENGTTRAEITKVLLDRNCVSTFARERVIGLADGLVDDVEESAADTKFQGFHVELFRDCSPQKSAAMQKLRFWEAPTGFLCGLLEGLVCGRRCGLVRGVVCGVVYVPHPGGETGSFTFFNHRAG